MTQREKLVKLLMFGFIEWKRNKKKRSIYEGFADYLLENGVVVTPCNMGDKMYCDGKYFASHCKGKIMEFPVNVIETTVMSTFQGEIDVQFDFDDFGKTVFLTKEEAEKVLAKQERGQ